MSRQEHALFSFLNLLSIPFTRNYLENLISGLGGNSSLSCISNVLSKHYNVENVCLLIDKNDINKLEAPFLVQLDLPTAPIAIVTDIKDSQIFFVYKGRKTSEPLPHFLEKWSGIVLLAEPSENSRENQYWKHKQQSILDQSRLPLFVVLCGVLLFHFGKVRFLELSQHNYIPLLLLLSYTLGLVVSTLLLAHQTIGHNSFVQKICNGTTKKGCSRILESDASKFMGLVSWSEIGFFYFLSALLAFLLIDNSVGFLFLLSVCALPYTFWSIYYQWRVARQWCAFCLTIQLTFWAIFIIYLFYFQFRFPVVDVSSSLSTLSCFLSIALFLLLILPYAKSYYKIDGLNFDYRTFKFNPNIIESSFELSNKVDTTTASSIVFGDFDSEVVVTVITDVYCPHCVEAHQHVKELLQAYGDQIYCQIVFAIPEYIESAGDYYNRIVTEKHAIIKSLIGIYLSYDKSSSEAIYHQWYDSGKNDYKKFLNKHSVMTENALIEQEFDKQLRWFKKMNAPGTPAFIINHRQMPVWYRADELSSLISAIVT